MWHRLKEVDRIIRGQATRPADLRDRTIKIPLASVPLVLVILGMVYGVCMGCYALTHAVVGPAYMQLLASIVKVPAIFFLTLVVTFPSLYVFNALVGSQLNVLDVLRLLIASLAVNLAVLSALGPIVAFFSVFTESYSFMVLFNVLVFTISGSLGLVFLLQTLNRMSIAQHEPWLLGLPGKPKQQESKPPPTPEAADKSETPAQPEVIDDAGPLDQIEGHMFGSHVKTVFGCWVVLFGLVGAQMGWVLRPFIGDPNRPFEWFRQRESNFFQAVLGTIGNFLSELIP